MLLQVVLVQELVDFLRRLLESFPKVQDTPVRISLNIFDPSILQGFIFVLAWSAELGTE